MKKVLFATTNEGKLREIRAILKDYDCEVMSLKDVPGLEQAEETGTTFEENATIKALSCAKQTGIITLSDDSGLEVDAMDKQPGIYSARFLGEDTSYDIKNQYIIDQLAGVEGEDRSARFVCAMCVAWPDGTSKVIRGTMEGRIGFEIAGENGFGYDPIFFLPEYGCTSAELSPEKKNEISHRGKALRDMVELLKERRVI